MKEDEIALRQGYIENKSFILNYIKENSIGLEIGVWKGKFSEFINNQKQLSHFYLCDPWKFQSEFPNSWYGGGISQEQQDMDMIFENVNNNLGKYDHITILRDYSKNLPNYLEDNSLDWVYIDGNHVYEYVLEDLKISFNLTKPQGIILGDDYSNHHPGVIKATQDFLNQYQDKVELLEIKNKQFVIKKL